MCSRVAKALANRAAGDLIVAKKLGPCSDIDDAVIGFYAQQMVEKSVKAALALRDVAFPMMEHDLDFLLALAADSDIEIPAELTNAAWLTPWGTTYENGEAPPGTLDRREAIAIGNAAVSWCADLIGENDPSAGGDNPLRRPYLSPISAGRCPMARRIDIVATYGDFQGFSALSDADKGR